MKKLFLLTLLFTLSFSALIEELKVGQSPFVNVGVDCSNKTVFIESNTSNSYYLFYAEEVIGVKSGFNASIPFYGDIDKITEPFMLRCEGSKGYYTLTFDIDECSLMQRFYVVKEIVFKEAEEVEEENETKVDEEPPVVLNLHAKPSGWTNREVTISGSIEDNEGVYGYYFKCSKNDEYRFVAKHEINFKCSDEGENRAYVIPEDINNNKGMIYFVDYKIDKIKPTLSSFKVEPDWGRTYVNISVEGFDLGGSGIKEFYYSCNGKEFNMKEYSNENIFRCYSNGINSAYVYFVDNAGNTGKNFTIQYKIDRIKPYFKNFSVEYDDKGVFAWGSIGDDESGVRGYEYTCNDSWEFVKSSWIDIRCHGSGILRVIAYDNAGNKVEKIINYKPLSRFEYAKKKGKDILALAIAYIQDWLCENFNMFC